jgi:hypothetical protein
MAAAAGASATRGRCQCAMDHLVPFQWARNEPVSFEPVAQQALGVAQATPVRPDPGRVFVPQ